jgi:type I restriction enzyme M protein
MPKPPKDSVVFLNPKTCGIYKDGGVRYKTDPLTGMRTSEVDNELIEHVNVFLDGKLPDGAVTIKLSETFDHHVLVPTYYDSRYQERIEELLIEEKLEGITIGEMVEEKLIKIRGGHGSPSNDQRSGTIPYVKVSDIRGLRININPTNLVTDSVARRFWHGSDSGLQAWDLLTPNRASSNIGEFAVLLPGEERIVITREVFILRVVGTKLFDHSYLLWALSLKAVREQWRRIALMQTNREDCGTRHLEIILPKPKSKAWADKISEPFRKYFTTIAHAKNSFIESVLSDRFEHVANVATILPVEEAEENSDEEQNPIEDNTVEK